MNWWLKAILVGALGSLVMFIIMMLGIHVTGMAPFNMPPSAAFLESLNLNMGPLPLVVHFGYGAFWSVMLMVLFRERASLGRGIGLAVALWLFMMVIYSPIIGWGFFGLGGPQMEPDNPLYLEQGPKYLVMTLVLHLIYGAIIGWLNPAWIATHELAPAPGGAREERSRDETPATARH